MSSKASLFVIFLTVFIDLLGFGMVLPLLPIYAKQFTTDDSGITIGLLMSSFSAMQFLFAPLWGRLSDRIGRRPVLMVGLAGSVVFYWLFGFATVEKSLLLMFVARIGAGIAGATISTAQAYIADCTTLDKRAKGMALIGAAFGLGFTFGPLFGALAVPTGSGDPGPGPGYAAAGLSLFALLLAAFKLPESLSAENRGANIIAAGRHDRRSWFDVTAFRNAMASRPIALLLAASFLCVFSFANFESTLSLIIKDERGPFQFTFRDVCLTFAFIGLVLTLVQGGVVRRLSGRVPESKMTIIGAGLEVVGFGLLIASTYNYSLWLLLTALAITVSGFGFMTPSINSLLSRWSDPAKQGGILGLGQSVTALSRILGPAIGIPLSRQNVTYPLWTAVVLMGVGGVLVLMAAKTGKDYPAAPK
ncbi:MAG: MFS transporter [Planctomycetia bacterium]|nr:MFS transporter [Planctomycetia bacterium]